MIFIKSLFSISFYLVFSCYCCAKMGQSIDANAEGLWEGRVSMVEKTDEVITKTGLLQEKDAIATVPIFYSRIATLDKDYHLTTKRGKGYFIKKGAVLFGAKVPAYDSDGNQDKTHAPVNWCLVRTEDNKSKKIDPETYCIVKLADGSSRFIESKWEFRLTPQFLLMVNSIKSAMPIFSEKVADAKLQLFKHLEISDISKRGFKLQWTLRDNLDDRPARRGSTTYDMRWHDDDQIKIEYGYGSFIVHKVDKNTVRVEWIDHRTPFERKFVNYGELLDIDNLLLPK